MSTEITEVGAFEAKTKLSSLLAQVERGKSFYITKHGRRVAEVKPVAPKRPRPKFGSGKHTILYLAPDFDVTPDGFKDYLR
jgi:prevent-host-death family protein